jgi:hypothetical protein
MEHILSEETLRKMKSLVKATHNGVPRTKKKI